MNSLTSLQKRLKKKLESSLILGLLMQLGKVLYLMVNLVYITFKLHFIKLWFRLERGFWIVFRGI